MWLFRKNFYINGTVRYVSQCGKKSASPLTKDLLVGVILSENFKAGYEIQGPVFDNISWCINHKSFTLIWTNDRKIVSQVMSYIESIRHQKAFDVVNRKIEICLRWWRWLFEFLGPLRGLQFWFLGIWFSHFDGIVHM